MRGKLTVGAGLSEVRFLSLIGGHPDGLLFDLVVRLVGVDPLGKQLMAHLHAVEPFRHLEADLVLSPSDCHHPPDINHLEQPTDPHLLNSLSLT